MSDAVDPSCASASGMRVHHVGFLAADLEAAARHLVEAFGYRVESDVIDDAVQTARVQFLRQRGAVQWLELVSPLGEGGKLQGALNRGVTLHHLCYEVRSVEEGLARLRSAGCLPIARPTPGAAFGGRRIAWAMSAISGLVELVEAGAGPRTLAELDEIARAEMA